MDAGDTSGEAVGGVEDRRVDISDLNAASHHLNRNISASSDESMTFFQKIHRLLGPYGPLAQ